MTLSQSLLPIVIFWAVIGGLGASLLLPSMQSLIHGNFQGPMQRRAYALVGAAAAIAAAVGPLVGGFITTYLSWRVAFGGEVVIIAIVLIGSRRVREVPYTGDRRVDVVGAILSALGMGGVVLGILVWQEGGGAVGALLAVGVAGLASLAWWLVKRKREGKPGADRRRPLQVEVLPARHLVADAAADRARRADDRAPDLSADGARVQRARGGGFARAALAEHVLRRPGRRQESGEAQSQPDHPGRLFAARRRRGGVDPDRAARPFGVVDGGSAVDCRRGPRPARLAAQQLHALPDRR